MQYSTMRRKTLNVAQYNAPQCSAVYSCTLVVAFSSRARVLGECSTVHSLPALFFFLKWRLARANLFYSLGQDQSTVVQRAVTTVTECPIEKVFIQWTEVVSEEGCALKGMRFMEGVFYAEKEFYYLIFFFLKNRVF